MLDYYKMVTKSTLMHLISIFTFFEPQLHILFTAIERVDILVNDHLYGCLVSLAWLLYFCTQPIVLHSYFWGILKIKTRGPLLGCIGFFSLLLLTHPYQEFHVSCCIEVWLFIGILFLVSNTCYDDFVLEVLMFARFPFLMKIYNVSFSWIDTSLLLYSLFSQNCFLF